MAFGQKTSGVKALLGFSSLFAASRQKPCASHQAACGKHFLALRARRASRAGISSTADASHQLLSAPFCASALRALPLRFAQRRLVLRTRLPRLLFILFARFAR